MATEAPNKEASRPHDIFISYSRKDKEFVRRLDGELARRGREAWVDWESIQPTEEFMQAIYGAIEGADTFDFVLTPDSVASAVCALEIAHAAAHNKRMVPIVAREVNADTVPEALAKLNWIFCRDGDNFEKATDTLISALDTDLNWVHAHTRLLTRAIEWNANSKNNSFVLRGEDLRSAEQWLAQAGIDKERQPTELQTEYIIASRRAATRRQRIISTAVSLALLVSVILTIIALSQRKLADKRRIEAEQASQVALARQLAAQSELARDQSAKSLSRSVLLAVEAMRRLPSLEADVALRRSASLLSRRLALTWCDSKILNLAVTADGRYAISGHEDETAGIWEIPSGKLLARVQAQGAVRSVLLSNDARYALLGVEGKGGKTMAQLCTVPDGKVINHIPSGLTEVAMTFSPDSKWCAVVTSHGILVLDLVTGKNNQPFRGEVDRVLAFSPDGKCLTSGRQVWDALDGKELAHLEFQQNEKGGVRSVAFSPDGKIVATGTADQLAILWDAATGQRLHTFRQKRQRTYAAFEDLLRHDYSMTVSFSEDGKYLATAGGDIQARVWEIEKEQEVAQLSHGNIVDWACFTGNGRQVLTTGNDATVRLWEIPTGHELTRITEDQDEGISLAVASRDGRYTFGIIARVGLIHAPCSRRTSQPAMGPPCLSLGGLSRVTGQETVYVR
jgi:hypothetical protein